MKDRDKILVVDDEYNTREALLRFLRQKFDVKGADNGSQAIDLLKEQDYALVLTDLRMPEADGMSVLEAAAGKAVKPVCIMLTAYGTINDAVAAMKKGAFDFVVKPLKLEQLEKVISAGLEKFHRRNTEVLKTGSIDTGDVQNSFAATSLKHDEGTIIPEDRENPMSEIFRKAYLVAGTNSTVLLLGESGTGKEIMARFIHDNSERRGLFVPVHCAAFAASLLEDELFGHEAGAFTNAVTQRRGRFELADNGTVFLDEIGEIDAQTQVKLLRVLETRCFERLGGTKTVKSNFRLIAATNRDLKAMVDCGEFREDLFYRLSVVNLVLPPLRKRRSEICGLIKKFLADFAAENGREICEITPEAMQILEDYSWPGNIRELRNCIENMVVFATSRQLGVGDIPAAIREDVENGGVSCANAVPGNVHSGKVHSPAECESASAHEYAYIRKVLLECGNNRAAAARALGISRSCLYRKLQKMDEDDKKTSSGLA